MQWSLYCVLQLPLWAAFPLAVVEGQNGAKRCPPLLGAFLLFERRKLRADYSASVGIFGKENSPLE